MATAVAEVQQLLRETARVFSERDDMACIAELARVQRQTAEAQAAQEAAVKEAIRGSSAPRPSRRAPGPHTRGGLLT